MNLALTFDISRDQDLAAVDVQNAVNLAMPQLPAAVRQLGVTITKANPDILARSDALVERSALRRVVPEQLRQALHRR